jgi:hypothetical protein
MKNGKSLGIWVLPGGQVPALVCWDDDEEIRSRGDIAAQVGDWTPFS